MGIPYYVASLLKAHRHISQKCLPGTPLEVDCLGVDFNCFLHAYLNAENPVGSIVVAFHDLVTNVVRAKKVYVAFDGLVPYAKMVQQRYRRMRRGETGAFDKHQISPGTPYMREVADTLRFMYPELIVSDTLEPGEGEHKIFTWLRSLPTDERKTTVIYGLDADLLVIALAQSDLSAIKLLREQETGEYSTLDILALKAVLPTDVPTFGWDHDAAAGACSHARCFEDRNRSPTQCLTAPFPHLSALPTGPIARRPGIHPTMPAIISPPPRRRLLR